MPSLTPVIAAATFALLAIAPRSALGSSIDAKIGWLGGGCLAVLNSAIEPGASVTFLLFDPERGEGDVPAALLVPGSILRKAPPSTSCAAPRVEVNGAEADWTLYEAEIATVHAPSRATGLGLIAMGDNIDLDGNGETDSFGLCRTGEGVQLDIWSDGLGRGERLWSALLRSTSKFESAPCDPVEVFYAPLGPFEAQVGYVHKCLAIKDPTLAPGTWVTIIAPNERYEIGQRLLTRILQGTVGTKLDGDEHCPPLHDALRPENESEGVSFYEITLEQGGLIIESEAIIGIAIVGLDAPAEKRIDLDGNGEDDSFTVCKSLEGLNFELWSGAPEQGEPLWRAYYYLFYDSAEWDCPGMFDEPDGTVP